ncbi:MAG: Bax inhibitor-1/YccA family protein [Chlamydiota bacterium]
MSLNDRDYIRHDGYPAVDVVSSFATRVYGWMTMGLLTTTLVCLLLYATGAYITLQPLWWVGVFGALGVGLAFNFLMKKLSFSALAMLFIVYSALEGMFFGIFVPLYAAAYGGQLIWMTFATTALVFSIALFYGIFTKADLTSLGKILQIALMGLIGVTFIFLIMSFFTKLTMFHLIISWVGLIIFVGLTAYDAQQIRNMSSQIQDNSEMAGKLSLVMAFRMYINVIMIFWYLLQILSSGSRK